MSLALFKALGLTIAIGCAVSGCANQASRSSSDQDFQEALDDAFIEAWSTRALYGERPLEISVAQYTVQIALLVVSELHIDPAPTPELVLAGFAELTGKYAGFSFSANGPNIAVSRRGEEVYRFLQPPAAAQDLWAEQVHASLNAFVGPQSATARPSLDQVLDTFLAGVTDGLDRYAEYYTREDVRQRERYLAKELAKVGIGLEAGDAGAIVQSISDFEILDGESLQRGDTVLSIDGMTLAGLDRPTVEGSLYGPPGSTATLKVIRDNQGTPFFGAVNRRLVNSPSLRARSAGSLLHVQITGLDRRTAVQLTDALAKTPVDNGTGPKGVVLDLRNNPGGYLDSGAAVADVFLAEGEMFALAGRNPASNQSMRARENAPTNWLPLVVLTSKETGGAAEMVASGLQDLGRAIVVGLASRGGGMVQIARRLPNGGALYFTWAEAVTAGGYRVEQRGVLPTVCVGRNTTADAVVAALRSGEGILDSATRTRWVDPNDETALAAHRALCAPRTDGEDISLEIARAILEEPGLYDRILELDKGSKAAALQ